MQLRMSDSSNSLTMWIYQGETEAVYKQYCLKYYLKNRKIHNFAHYLFSFLFTYREWCIRSGTYNQSLLM